MSGLGQPLANRLNRLIPLIGNVGNFLGRRLQTCGPVRGVVLGRSELIVGELAIIIEDLADQSVLGFTNGNDCRRQAFIGRRAGVAAAVLSRRSGLSPSGS